MTEVNQVSLPGMSIAPRFEPEALAFPANCGSWLVPVHYAGVYCPGHLPRKYHLVKIREELIGPEGSLRPMPATIPSSEKDPPGRRGTPASWPGSSIPACPAASKHRRSSGPPGPFVDEPSFSRSVLVEGGRAFSRPWRSTTDRPSQ